MTEEQFMKATDRLREICEKGTEESVFDDIVEFYSLGREILEHRAAIENLPFQPRKDERRDWAKQREEFFQRLDKFVNNHHHNKTPSDQPISLATLYYGWIGDDMQTLAYAQDYNQESCLFTQHLLREVLTFQRIYLATAFLGGPSW